MVWGQGLFISSYIDYVEVADVISDYAAANIPLEVMWTDIGTFLPICQHERLIVEPFGRLYGQEEDIYSRSQLFPYGQDERDCRLPTRTRAEIRSVYFFTYLLTKRS